MASNGPNERAGRFGNDMSIVSNLLVHMPFRVLVAVVVVAVVVVSVVVVVVVTVVCLPQTNKRTNTNAHTPPTRYDTIHLW